MKTILFLIFFIPIASFNQGKYFGGNGNDYASSSTEITALSIGSMEQDKVITYPNPVICNIHFSEEITEPMEVLDINGKIILKFKPNQNKIKEPELAQGIYFLKYENRTYQFVKNNKLDNICKNIYYGKNYI